MKKINDFLNLITNTLKAIRSSLLSKKVLAIGSVFVGALVLVSLGYFFIIKGDKSPKNLSGNVPAQKGQPIFVTPVETMDIYKEFVTFGNLKPWKEVTLSPGEKFTVEKVLVEVGSEVEKDDSLVKFESEIHNLKKKLEKIELELKTKDFKLTQKLAMKNFVSKNELYRKQLELKAQVLRNKLESLIGDQSVLKSPIEGIVSVVNLKEGDYITKPSKQTIQIIDSSKFKIEINLPYEIVRYLKIDDEVTIFRTNTGIKKMKKVPEKKRKISSWGGKKSDTKDSGKEDNTVEGIVRGISPKLDPKTGTVAVELNVEYPPLSWKAGMFVKISITTESEEGALAIPNDAIIMDKDKRHIFRVVEKGDVTTVEKISPNFGISDGRYSVVHSGIDEEDEIVLKGQGSLNNNSVVRIVDQTDK